MENDPRMPEEMSRRPLEVDMGDAAVESQGSSIEFTPRDQMEVFRKNARKLYALKGKH